MCPQRHSGRIIRCTACLLFSLAACATPPAIPTLTPAPTATLVPTLTPTAAATQGKNTKVFDIGGRGLFLLCEGKGSPTVLLESGMGDSISTWQRVMPALSEQTRVCAYDRAGLGFSDPPTVRPRTSQDIALDLHKLLAVAGEAGPYVLVGHSIGGLHVRVFAAEFPDEVVGVVLVDSSHPD
jgi:pimeloyl-ACP methyl ester carboxylesterase